jgi:DNA-binding Lrp family transcriptional regulator
VSEFTTEDYAKVGKEWPLSVSEDDVERANQSGSPERVYPSTFDPTILSEARLRQNAGYVGVPLIGGTIDLDHNPKLDSYDWRGSYDDIGIVDQMVREDPVAQAIRLAWTLPLLSVQWSVQPASDDPRSIEVAEFVQSCLFEHMKGGWSNFLEQAVQFTWRGLAAFEIVARFDKEIGATVIDRLAPRLPWTIYEWQQYPDGRYGFTQCPDPADPPKGKRDRSAIQGAVLPPEKLVLFRFQPEGDNPEPMGILRPAYSSWRQRRTYLTLEATGYERSAYGIPTCTVDPGANPGDVEQVNIILRELRAGIRAFAMFPKGFNLEWTECPMKADAIRHARIAAGQDMARAALCQFLFTGESAGAYSLIQGQLDHYTMALQQAANSIATTLSQGPHALIKRLVNWNFHGVTEYPYIQAGEVRVGDPKQLVEAVKTAVDAGVVTPDDQIEAKIRDVLSLPQRVDNAARPIDVDPSTGPGQNAPVEPGDDELPDSSPPDEPSPEGGEPSTSSRGEEQARGEQEDLHEHSEDCSCRPISLAEVEERVQMDIYVEGPKGRDVRPVEKSVRYSEVSGVKDEANRAIADTITNWRNDIIDDYSATLAEEETVDEMLLVPVPRVDELENLLIDELRVVYNKGVDAVDREIERQEKDPSLTVDIEEQKARPSMDGDEVELKDGQPPLPFGMAEPVEAPDPLEDEEGSYIDDIVPEEAIASTAATAAKEAAERVQRVAISSVQSAGVGGAVPPADVALGAIAGALAVLSVGVDYRAAQQVSNLTYGLGRAQGLRSSEAKRYIYSNLAESVSCGPCEDRDGNTFGAEELPTYATPASWCVAGPMCNCLVIGLFQ